MGDRGQHPNVFFLFHLIIFCWDVATPLAAEETNCCRASHGVSCQPTVIHPNVCFLFQLNNFLLGRSNVACG